MIAKILYINLPRDWRGQSMFSSEELDVELCIGADIVIRHDHGRFLIIKDRYTLEGTVPMKGLDFK